ncbi:hydrolase [Longimycelium tulufanense]|uniref:Hydrolase n=1 Tax=Longimycelium tulufanense TaxID=907463 RepID=A0A8J3FT00_9PSEU|nr:HAD-IA family hydrolase [Longimycelium tulufanense]GGM44499.1 hydrolase [Longimycelium tulufanense]
MTIRAVLFDFSGTLYRLEKDGPWLADLVDGEDLVGEHEVELVRRLTAPVGPLDGLPDHLQDAWARRDLDPAVHREVHLAMFDRVGLPAHTAEAFYARLVDPGNWRPYPDAVQALRTVRDAGIRSGIISNIPWDIRTALKRDDALELVDDLALSYVEGRIKPDPELFRLACRRLGVAPEEALMIGDSVTADGGAAEVGSRVAFVEPLPTAQRPTALLDALAAHGVR